MKITFRQGFPRLPGLRSHFAFSGTNGLQWDTVIQSCRLETPQQKSVGANIVHSDCPSFLVVQLGGRILLKSLTASARPQVTDNRGCGTWTRAAMTERMCRKGQKVVGQALDGRVVEGEGQRASHVRWRHLSAKFCVPSLAGEAV